jgi:hypothetical protein
MNSRQELLLKMYDQMFNDINRHIMVVWQSVGVLIGAFAIFALVEKNVISLDIATSIILLLCFWLMCHLLDAGYWYNRNLIIIANIERQFLEENDLKNIHYYFGKHRPTNMMIEHLRIQFYLGIGLAAIVLIYHFIERVYPGICLQLSNFDPIRAIPYLLLVIATVYVFYLKNKLNDKYKEFLSNSPGIDISSNSIHYGVGHGN